MTYIPTETQNIILEQMTHYPESPKTIAARLPSSISRQNVSQQCRIMADNDIIKQHGRGQFSLKPERQATLREFLDAAPIERPPEPKKLTKTQRDATSVETFAEEYSDHYRWLINASTRGNSFAISLLSQLKSGWMLTQKQLVCIEKSLVWQTGVAKGLPWRHDMEYQRNNS